MKLFAVLLLSSLSLVVYAADPVSDDELYDKVRIALANDRDVKGGSIEVAVKQGEVALSGSVRTEKQKTKAEKVARKTKGVQKVVNNLSVAPI